MSMATDTSVILAENVQAIRRAKGMTQETLAAECEMSRPRISEIESGDFNPSIETVEKIATALGVPVHRLFQVQKKNSR